MIQQEHRTELLQVEGLPIVWIDIETGWVECLPFFYRSKHAVINALEHARQLIPFPKKGT